MSLSQDIVSDNTKIPLHVRFEALQKKHRELEAFNEVCVQTLRQQGDWKKHYQDLSKDNRELRKELERWQKRSSPVELALRHNWVRPNVYLRNLAQGFTERELVEYLWYQLEIVEPGLRFCGEQVQCGNGIIDLVAEDMYGKHVLTELKVVGDDHRLLAQVVRYPKAYSERYGVSLNDIRIVVIAPSYGNLFRQELLKVGVTLFKYVNGSAELAVTRV